MRFIGDYPGKTDAKGRVFLPAPFRKVLREAGDERLILRTDLHQPCLVLYPEALWNEMLDELRSRLSRWDKGHQALLRRFAADAEVAELDASGRVLINRRKLQFAGIGQEVRFLAVDDHIEVWDKGRCDALLAADAGALGDDLQAVMGDAEFGL